MLSRRFLRIKALKSLYSHYTIEDENLIETRNKMLFSVGKTYDLYFLLMRLIVEVADYAQEAIEINKTKHLATAQEKKPNMKFVENSFIQAIRNSETINKYVEKNSITWGDNKDLFKKLYASLCKRDFYNAYMESSERSFEQDKDAVLRFYKKEIEGNTALFDVVEEMNLYWVDEVEFIASKVISSFVKWTEEEEKIYTLFIDKEDEQYIKDLLINTISSYDKVVELIKKNSKNWDSERVTIMDRVIIAMAYTEFVDFPSIPINVSLDEYIEISKFYSTPNSSIYVNGILDKILTDLRRENLINKAGRGLQ